MRILDENNLEIESPNLEIGYLIPDRIFIQHHEAVEAVEEQFHYEYTVFPNGGKEREKIIDVEAVEAVDAWDEYEDILRYVLYTEEELEQRKKAAEEAYKQSPEYRIEELEAALELLLSGVTE